MKQAGIDIGTTTISAVVVDSDSKQVIEAVTVPNGTFLKTGNNWEKIQDAGLIIQKSLSLLDRFLEKYEDITSIGLTGQMHGILYLDKEGRALSPLYTWQDTRGMIPLDHAAGPTTIEFVKEKTGITVNAGYGLVTHLYNIKKKIVPEGAATICTIADYFGMILTRRKSPLMHISNAASLGFYDSQKRIFLLKELECLGMDTGILPAVTDEFTCIGRYRNVPVMAAIGDNQASFLGAVGLRENIPLVNMGTGGQVSVLSSQWYEGNGIEARPITKDKYLLAGSSLCGGRAFAILEKFFRNYMSASGKEESPQYEVLLKLAQKGRIQYQHSAPKVVTAFHGTRENPSMRGSITGLDEENFTPEALVYGVLLGMAEELYSMYRTMAEVNNIKAVSIIGSGNGLRKNPVLQSIFEDIFMADLTMSPYEEEAACGAAFTGK
jgi:sedoheptulokinase